MPGGAHPLPAVELDGVNWPLAIASQLLDIPLGDLRVLVRVFGVMPAGRVNMRGYRSQGRTAVVYPAVLLVLLAEGVTDLRESLQCHGV